MFQLYHIHCTFTFNNMWMSVVCYTTLSLSLANNNRFEGSWANNMKNGTGKFIFLDKGQTLSGHWKDDIAKCGSLEDFDREHAPSPPVFPIPQVSIYIICVITHK